jgi:hypothetical protein
MGEFILTVEKAVVEEEPTEEEVAATEEEELQNEADLYVNSTLTSFFGDEIDWETYDSYSAPVPKI